MRRLVEFLVGLCQSPADMYWGWRLSKLAEANMGRPKLAPHPFIDMTPSGIDYRDLGPTLECVCGSYQFYILCSFDPDTREPSAYFVDAMCAGCNAITKAPTGVDEEAFMTPMSEDDFHEPSKDELTQYHSE